MICTVLQHEEKEQPPPTDRKRSHSPSPGRGFDRHGNLVGAAKAAHEAKLAREKVKKIKCLKNNIQENKAEAGD